MGQAPWIEASACFEHLGTAETFMGKSMSVPELNAWDGCFAGLQTPRRVFKTHAPVELAPWRAGVSSEGLGRAKVVVVTRNPKDACVSLFHHSRDGKFNYSGDFHHFTSNLFLIGNVESGCFWAWHAGWEKAAAEQSGIIWVSYEELKRDAFGTVRRLAKELDIHCTDDEIAKTVGASSFSAMKSLFNENEKKFESKGMRAKKNHIRKGEMGSWRNDLDGALLVEFDAVHKLKTTFWDLTYNFDFGDQ